MRYKGEKQFSLLFLPHKIQSMASSFEKFQKRRVITSYFSVVLSIFLVLFLLGLLGLFVLNSKRISNNFKEEIAMTVFFKNDANDTIIRAFDEELKTAKFAKSYEYVSKEKAAEMHKKDIGEDFMQFLGVNPLQNSFDIYLKADYVVNDSIAKIQNRLRKNEMIADIVYDKQLVDKVNDKIQEVSLWILIFSGIFAVISVLLINSSLRLSIYANRFIIKTMQMVGATKSFIRKPFIVRSLILGLIGSLLAVFALIGVLVYFETNYDNLGIMDNQLAIAAVLLGGVVLGMLITWLSTFFATQRFLNLRTDDLY